MPPEGRPAPAMLMSFTMRSMAARMFCWVSARCVTSMVEFKPVLNRLVMAAITIRPSAIETISSSSVKPCPFCVCVFMCLVTWSLPESRNQRLHAVGVRNTRSSRDITDRHRDLLEVGVDGHSVRFEDAADLNLAGEIGQTHGHVIRGAQDAIGAGQHYAFRSGDTGAAGRAVHVIGRVDQTVGPGAKQLRLATGEDAAAAGVGDLA